MNTKKSCTTCEYYAPYSNEQDMGRCVIRAPGAKSYYDQNKGTTLVLSFQPEVEANEWCGEWVKKTND